MSVLDKFLNVMKLNDDDYDDVDYLDEAEDADLDDPRPRRRILRERDEDDFMDDGDDLISSSSSQRSVNSAASAKNTKARQSAVKTRGAAKVTSIRASRRRAEGSGMEVCVIRPHSMEDCHEITDTLLAGCTVILNVEGLEMELAQRIVDFASGSTYALDGNLQAISNYIIVLTPAMVDLSGDFQEILSGAFDVPFERRF